MKFIFNLFLLAIASMAFTSCKKSEGIKAKDRENQFVGTWKNTLGITNYEGEADAYIPDTDIYLIIGNNGVATLREDRKEWSGGRQVLRSYVVDGRYSLVSNFVQIQDRDNRDVYDHFTIDELTERKLKISISYSEKDHLQLHFEKQ